MLRADGDLHYNCETFLISRSGQILFQPLGHAFPFGFVSQLSHIRLQFVTESRTFCLILNVRSSRCANDMARRNPGELPGCFSLKHGFGRRSPALATSRATERGRRRRGSWPPRARLPRRLGHEPAGGRTRRPCQGNQLRRRRPHPGRGAAPTPLPGSMSEPTSSIATPGSSPTRRLRYFPSTPGRTLAWNGSCKRPQPCCRNIREAATRGRTSPSLKS